MSAGMVAKALVTKMYDSSLCSVDINSYSVVFLGFLVS